MLLHDVELLFDQLVGGGEFGAAAVLAARGPEPMLLRLEMRWDRVAAGAARRGFGRLRLRRQGRRLRAGVEGALSLVSERRRRLRLPLDRRRLLALTSLLALRDGQQLGDALVEPRDRREQLGDRWSPVKWCSSSGPRPSLLGFYAAVRPSGSELRRSAMDSRLK
jgi:hypothetical protein